MPRGFFALAQGWNEPLLAFLLAATVLCAIRMPRFLPYMLGLFLTGKQYLIVLLPLIYLLMPIHSGRAQKLGFLVKMVLTAAIVTLPFVLWDPSAFWHSTVRIHQLQPWRKDSLSFLALWAWMGNGQLGTFFTLTVVVIATLLVLLKLPRSPAGFALGAAVVLMSAFSFGPQAFCNYYYLIISALCLAMGVDRRSVEYELQREH
jgi:uncharacterized membrane protein